MTTAAKTPASPAAEAVEDSYTMHQSSYVSAEALEAEFQSAFSDTWQYVGPLAKLQNPGDHIVAVLGRTPIVVSRDSDGSLKGMINICRHRLHPVALEDGTAKMLQCRYHGWSYRLDGSLLNAPRCRDELPLSKSDHGLLPIAVETLGPWVFANRDAHAQPLTTLLEDCREFVEHLVEGAERFTFHEQTTANINGNWKLFVENGIECYHCPLIHSETFARAFKVGSGEYESRVYSHVNTQYGPPRTVPVDMPPGREPNGFQFMFLPPNSLIGMDDFAMFVLRVVPTGPTTCDVVADQYFDKSIPADTLDEWVSVYYTQTLQEDAVAVELQQAGFTAGDVTHGRLLTDSENSIKFFENWLRTRLKGHNQLNGAP